MEFSFTYFFLQNALSIENYLPALQSKNYGIFASEGQLAYKMEKG